MTRNGALPPEVQQQQLPLVLGRECGPCVVCCKVPAIDTPELQKPAGVLCQHCSGKDCTIYERRPGPCRTYFCLYRRIEQMPDQWRPDQCGVMFSIEGSPTPQNPFEHLFVIGRAVNALSDFDSPLAQEAIQFFVKLNNIPVWLSFAQERRLFHPYPALRDAILNPAQCPTPLVQEMRIWRQRLQLP